VQGRKAPGDNAVGTATGGKKDFQSAKRPVGATQGISEGSLERKRTAIESLRYLQFRIMPHEAEYRAILRKKRG